MLLHRAMATSAQERIQQAQSWPHAHAADPCVRTRNGALWRMNLRSSAIGAAAGAIVVGLLAAIDPAIPWANVGLRAAAAFALGATIGLALSSSSYVLYSLRLRHARDRSAHPSKSAKFGAG